MNLASEVKKADWPKYIKWAGLGLFVILLAIIVFYNRATFLLVAISFFFAYLVNPVVAKLEKRGMSRFWAIWLLVLGAILLVAILFLIIVPQIQNQTRDMVTKAPDWWSNIESYSTQLFETKIQNSLWYKENIQPLLIEWQRILGGEGNDTIKEYAKRLWNWFRDNSEQIINSVRNGFQKAFDGVANFIVFCLNLILFPVFTYYFIKDYSKIVNGFYELFPAKWGDEIRDWLGEIDQVLGSYLRGQFTIALTLGLLYSVGLSILGVPMGAILGLVAGLANLVPYMSTFVGIIPSIVLSLLDEPNLWRVLWILLLFTGGQILESMVLGPKIMGDEVGLHPVVVIVAIIVGASLFGLPGLILSVPVTAIGKVVFIRLHGSWIESWEKAN